MDTIQFKAITDIQNVRRKAANERDRVARIRQLVVNASVEGKFAYCAAVIKKSTDIVFTTPDRELCVKNLFLSYRKAETGVNVVKLLNSANSILPGLFNNDISPTKKGFKLLRLATSELKTFLKTEQRLSYAFKTLENVDSKLTVKEHIQNINPNYLYIER